MYNQLTPKDQFDKSPFLFFRNDWLRTRLNSVYEEYLNYKRNNPARIDSNHLLIKLLSNITIPFDGDLVTYISKVDSQTRRIGGVNGLTSASVRGDVFKDDFYKGANHVITLSRSDVNPMDVWFGWKDVAPVTVHSHAITDVKLFDPVVEGTPKVMNDDEYVMINIDLPLMAAQYRMFKSSFPEGTYERYISQYVIPGMMKSHLDIVLFNNVMVKLGLMESKTIQTNLPFAQPSLMKQVEDLAGEIASGLLNKALTPRQVLSTIPASLSDSDALTVLKHPSLLVTQQSLWALHSQSVDKALMILTVAKKRNDYSRCLPLIARIRRDNIQLHQEGWYRNGLKSSTQIWLMKRWERVLDLLPDDVSLESLEADGWED